MLISTIIPVYNASKTINRCIDSILDAQIYDVSNEIILVNDGSTDNSLDICLEYKVRFPNIKVFSQENQGPSSARNKGIETAIGHYITFVDSDDYVHNDYFRIIKQYVSENPDIIIFSYYKQKGSSIKKISNHSQVLNNIDIINLIKNSSHNMNLFWYPWMKVYKSQIVRNIKFHPEIKVGEDTVFNLEAFISSDNIRIIENNLYYYVETEGSLTNVNYKPNLMQNMITHYETRKAIHKNNLIIQGIEFQKDIASYYINHILFWLLSNSTKAESQNVRLEIKEIRNSIIFRECFKHYIYNWQRPKMSFYIKLFELKQYWLLVILFR